MVAPATGLVASCKAEIADLEFAVGVDQKVAWFEVAVEDVGGVDVL